MPENHVCASHDNKLTNFGKRFLFLPKFVYLCALFRAHVGREFNKQNSYGTISGIYNGAKEFRQTTKELTDVLRRNRTIDWNRKESARAKMRVMVKRLLKKYKYPPKSAEKALETVMRQCDHWTDEDENVEP